MPGYARAAEIPSVYGPTDDVDPKLLAPTVRIRRYTDAAPGGGLDVIAPCCGRIARLRGDWLRADHLVLCTPCDLAYEVHLIDENDGGFGALFIVRDEQPVLTRRRTTGWLARQHPGDGQPPAAEDRRSGGRRANSS